MVPAEVVCQPGQLRGDVQVGPVPKVSVVMSCYNKAAFLRETVASVLSQSFTDFEFVIFDNKSTDDSASIVREFCDPRIRFHQNSRNLGPQASMNNGLENARGEYLVIFHGDDLWDERFLEVNVAWLDLFRSASLCCSLMHYVDESGTKSLNPRSTGSASPRTVGHEEALQRLFKGNFLQTPTVMYRRDKMPLFDFRYTYVGDWDMYLRMAAAGNQFLFLDEALVFYRQSSGSETSIGVNSGGLIIESYLMLRNFFGDHPSCRRWSGKAFGRLSSATLRRARVAASREQVFFLIRFAAMCNPLQLVNPVLYLYLLVGLLFGPAGVRLLKRSLKKGAI